MPKYTVFLKCESTETVQIEAANMEEAWDKAEAMVKDHEPPTGSEWASWDDCEVSDVEEDDA